MKVIEHWHRLATEAMESSSMVMFKTQLVQPAPVDSALSNGVGQNSLRRSVPTSAIL